MPPVSLFISGLGMFVPDPNREVMHVLFPRHMGGADERHYMRAAFRAGIASGLTADDGVPYKEAGGAEWFEVSLDDTDNAIGRRGSPLSYAIDSRVMNFTRYSKNPSIPNQFLKIGSPRPGVLNARLALFAGTMGSPQVYRQLKFEMAEQSGNKHYMACGVCWEIGDLGSPLVLNIVGRNGPKQVMLDISSGTELIILSHTTMAEFPQTWPGRTHIETRDHAENSTPHHIRAYHQLTREAKPTPKLRYIGIKQGDLIPVQALPCERTQGLIGERRGIHPITCVLTSGDPDDPDNPDSLSKEAGDAESPQHEHSHGDVAVNPHDRSRASIIA